MSTGIPVRPLECPPGYDSWDDYDAEQSALAEEPADDLATIDEPDYWVRHENGSQPLKVDPVADAAPEPDLDLDAFLAQEEPDYEWVVPGLLERGDRLILTGPEGGGKSTLIRQMAVQMGAGIHPFSLEEIDPVKVMMVDLENSRRQVKRELRPLRIAAGEMPEGKMRVRVVAQGLDLLREEHRTWLERRIEANEPDVVFIGPLYKLASGDPTEERVARTVALELDRLRSLYQIVIVMEAHSPHAQGRGPRPERPYGASLWVRWPEFGLFLDRDGPVRHWRGARDEREWPSLLKRGGAWPWTPVTDVRAVTFSRMLEEVRSAGTRLSERALAERIEGADKAQIHRAIVNNRAEWETVLRDLEEET